MNIQMCKNVINVIKIVFNVRLQMFWILGYPQSAL